MEQTIKTENFTLEIMQDTDTESPREWDNLGTMVCFHNRYSLGDKHDYTSNDFNGWADMKKKLAKEHDAAVILPIYMYDHSGITIKTTPFGDQWDSGQIGYIFISKKKVREEYNVKRINAKLRECVEGYLKGEVETYDQFLTGDVYSFSIENEQGDTIDSCGGFYGSNIKENGMLEYISEEVKKELKEKFGNTNY